jgi:hypothetical protein
MAITFKVDSTTAEGTFIRVQEIALTPGNFFPVPVSIPLERHRSIVAGFHRSLCSLDVASSRREDWCGISVAILGATHH